MLGYGLGLRSVHYDHVLTHKPAVDWFELITENYLAPGGRPRAVLREIRANYPVALHGLSFNVGTDEPLDIHYLDQLKRLIAEVEPAWVSDHLCWTGLHGYTSHDLLPIAYTEENLQRVADKVSRIQDYLQHRIVLENPSIYIGFRSSSMTEPEFINALVRRAGCEILLDINNVYVSSFNLGFDPRAYIDTLTPSAIRQFHLAGHTNNVTHIIDTHDHPVCDEVWELYRYACGRFGPVATLLERDDHIPEFSELMIELEQAKTLQEQALQQRALLKNAPQQEALQS
ncbi:MAG: hypothetical protein A3H44_03150 [Gammaproteobacteria bacterium RIFCSPLOWO2_02_FULL_57_10]|nr:MAG: hypothetical protein A3H44_03150 [Gammaproteobacteria bacterium RIFCSPLOWO2_02_FULL_57_10]